MEQVTHVEHECRPGGEIAQHVVERIPVPPAVGRKPVGVGESVEELRLVSVGVYGDGDPVSGADGCDQRDDPVVADPPVHAGRQRPIRCRNHSAWLMAGGSWQHDESERCVVIAGVVALAGLGAHHSSGATCRCARRRQGIDQGTLMGSSRSCDGATRRSGFCRRSRHGCKDTVRLPGSDRSCAWPERVGRRMRPDLLRVSSRCQVGWWSSKHSLPLLKEM